MRTINRLERRYSFSMRYPILDKIWKSALRYNPSFESEIVSYNSINEQHAALLRDILDGLNMAEKNEYKAEVEHLRHHHSNDIYYYIASQIEAY